SCSKNHRHSIVNSRHLGSKTSLKISLSDQDLKTLASWQRSPVIPALTAMRGRIILLLAAGKSVTEVSRIMDASRPFIYKWAGRFVLRGIVGLKRSSQCRTRKTAGKTKEPVRVPTLALSDEDRHKLRSWQ